MSLTPTAIGNIISELEKELALDKFSKVIVHGDYAEEFSELLKQKFLTLDIVSQRLLLEQNGAYIISTRPEDLHYYDSSYGVKQLKKSQPQVKELQLI